MKDKAENEINKLTKCLVINPFLKDSRRQRCRSNGTKVKKGTLGMLTQRSVKSDGSVTAVSAVALRWPSGF